MVSATIPVRQECRCPRCNTLIGTRTREGVRLGRVLAVGHPVLQCPRCKFEAKHAPLSAVLRCGV